jgi:pimeloyl-ACP methyl ester carboxylesterase
MRKLGLILAMSALAVFLYGPPTAADSGAEATAPTSPVIVIGFLGGYVHRDNMIHSEVQLAAKLRSIYSAGVYVEALENHRAQTAYPQILRLLDTDHDGTLTDAEKRSARIILYGHSWGACEIVALARRLQEDSIPVLLTVQVDSISKHHLNDSVIPPNVAEAANFYQPDSVLHGRTEIRAADPEHTKILGNFRFDYKEKPVRCYNGYGWLVRHFARTHAEIECDPSVWDQVESLIRSKLPPVDSQVHTPTTADLPSPPTLALQSAN